MFHYAQDKETAIPLNFYFTCSTISKARILQCHSTSALHVQMYCVISSFMDKLCLFSVWSLQFLNMIYFLHRTIISFSLQFLNMIYFLHRTIVEVEWNSSLFVLCIMKHNYLLCKMSGVAVHLSWIWWNISCVE
jgi:hypothetical protein